MKIRIKIKINDFIDKLCFKRKKNEIKSSFISQK